MFKLGASTTESSSTAANDNKAKKPDPKAPASKTPAAKTTSQQGKKKDADKKENPPAEQPVVPPKNANADDYLDRNLYNKADLDYIPGLDYDLGPVLIPCKDFLLEKCT